MSAQTVPNQVKSPDFDLLRRRHKQMFLVTVFSQFYLIVWSFYVAFTSSSPVVSGLLALGVFILCIFTLRSYFSPKQALLVTGSPDEIIVHFTPYSSVTIPADELSGVSWSGNQLKLKRSNGKNYGVHVGWMSYVENQAVRRWLENFATMGS